jgi:predicted metal-dependent peptidase
MKITNQKAYDRVIKARTTLVMREPFFGCLALHLNLVEWPELKQWPGGNATMAVDGINMYYYPEFVLSLSERQLMGVVAHEVMHCCLQHMTRRGKRFPRIWNYAGDYVINADLLAANFELPAKRLHDVKYDGMSTEEVYARLMQDATIIKIRGFDGGGDLTGDEDLDESGCGAVWDAAPAHDKAGNAQVAGEWEGNVRMALGVAQRAHAGKTPGYINRLLGLLQRPRISWHEKTRDWIDETMTRDYSWSRPNRRMLGQDIILPGFVPDALHKLVFVIDVSGSVSNELANNMLTEVAGALSDGTADELVVLYSDTEVKHVDEYMPGDVVKCQVVAGGGTDFRSSFEWIRTNAPDANGIVYLTDMEPWTWTIPSPDLPVLWGAFSPTPRLNVIRPIVPFGDIVHIDGAE